MEKSASLKVPNENVGVVLERHCLPEADLGMKPLFLTPQGWGRKGGRWEALRLKSQPAP